MRSEPRALFRLAAVAAALLAAYTVFTQDLPQTSFRWGLLVSTLVNLSLIGLLCVGLLPLRDLGHRSLLVGLVGIAVGLASTAAGWETVGNLGKVVFAAALGFWLAEQIESLWVCVLIAALSSLADIVSVFWGPTNEILDHGGRATVGYFTIAFGWPGYRVDEVYSALGVSDIIFFSLYLCAARRFGLRTAASVVAMVLSVLVTMVIGLHESAVPALPLLAVAFVGVNIDLLFGRRARRLRRA